MRAILKAFGILLLLPLCMMYITLVLVLATLHTLNATVGNSTVFQEEFDKNITTEDLKSVARQLTDVLVPKESATSADGNALGFQLDENWFADACRRLILGTHAYITGAKAYLPTLPIKPLLDRMQESLTEGIVQHAGSDAESSLQKLAAALKKLPGGGLSNGEPTDMAVVLLMADSSLISLDFSRETAISILKEILVPSKNQNEANLLPRVIHIIVADMLHLDKARANLDLNLFFVNFFASDNHIVRVAHDSMQDISKAVFSTLLLALLLIMLLITAFSFSRSGPPAMQCPSQHTKPFSKFSTRRLVRIFPG